VCARPPEREGGGGAQHAQHGTPLLDAKCGRVWPARKIIMLVIVQLKNNNSNREVGMGLRERKTHLAECRATQVLVPEVGAFFVGGLWYVLGDKWLLWYFIDLCEQHHPACALQQPRGGQPGTSELSGQAGACLFLRFASPISPTIYFCFSFCLKSAASCAEELRAFARTQKIGRRCSDPCHWAAGCGVHNVPPPRRRWPSR
jgi:hypothetical protein